MPPSESLCSRGQNVDASEGSRSRGQNVDAATANGSFRSFQQVVTQQLASEGQARRREEEQLVAEVARYLCLSSETRACRQILRNESTINSSSHCKYGLLVDGSVPLFSHVFLFFIVAMPLVDGVPSPSDHKKQLKYGRRHRSRQPFCYKSVTDRISAGRVAWGQAGGLANR